MDPLLSIIIVDYNARDLIIPCLNSIVSNVGNLDYEIIIVDNASKENYLADYQKISPKVKTVRLDKNLGFGGGNNFGAKQAQGKYLLLLNPDTLMVDDTIEKILNFIKSHENIGIVCPRLFVDTNQSSPEEVDYYGDFPTLSTLISRNNHRHISNHQEYLEVERVTGACMLLKKDLYNQVGGFDENFFMYFEDTDLCKKVSKLGLKIIVLNNTHLVHFGGKSQNSSKLKKRFYYTSQNHFFQKHYGFFSTALLRIVRAPYILLQNLKR